MPNGIDLVRADQERIRELFVRYNSTLDSSLVGQTIGALRAHDAVERAAVYALATRVIDDPALMGRLAVAHSAVRKQINTVGSSKGTFLIEAFQVLQAFVSDHIAVEQNRLLPRLVESATPGQLEELADRILQIKQPSTQAADA